MQGYYTYEFEKAWRKFRQNYGWAVFFGRRKYGFFPIKTTFGVVSSQRGQFISQNIFNSFMAKVLPKLWVACFFCRQKYGFFPIKKIRLTIIMVMASQNFI